MCVLRRRAAGAAQVPYRTFLIFNAIGGIIWGVGYCLLGYLAGSAYTVVEREVGTGSAIAIAALAVAALVAWAVRRRRLEPKPAEKAPGSAEKAPGSAVNAPALPGKPALAENAAGNAPALPRKPAMPEKPAPAENSERGTDS